MAFPLISISQTSETDSLRNVLASQGNDTLKVKTLLQFADAMTYVDLEKSFHYYKQANDLSDSLNYPFGMAESQYRIGLYYMKYKHLPDSSILYTNRAIIISDSLNYLKILLNSYRLKLIYYYSSHDWINMRYFSEKCLGIAVELNDSVGVGKVYDDFGIIAFNQGKYDTAIIWYMRALEIYEKKGVEKAIGNNYINLAKNYIHLDNKDLAEKYLIRA